MAPQRLVTGAAGFLGSNVGIFLNGRAHRTGLSRNPQASPLYDAHFNVDLRDHVALSNDIRAERPQVILHAAAYSGHVTCARNPDMAWAVNVDETRVISEPQCLKSNCPRSLIGASIRNARENGVGSAGFESDALADVGQGAGERGEVQLLGLALGECEEHYL